MGWHGQMCPQWGLRGSLSTEGRTAWARRRALPPLLEETQTPGVLHRVLTGFLQNQEARPCLPPCLDSASCLTPRYLKGREGTLQLGLSARATKRVSAANIKHVLPLTICLNALLNGGQHARTSPIWFGHMGRRLMGLKSCQLNQVTLISPLLPRRRCACARGCSLSPRSSPPPKAN